MPKSPNELMYEELLRSKEEMMSLLKQISADVNSVAAAMILECEKIRPELGRSYEGRQRRIMYKQTPMNGEGIIVTDAKEKPVEDVVPLGKRACSICRKRGHRKNSCPEK